MGLFNSKKVFNTKQQIKDALFQVKTLDYRQKPAIYEAILKELDDGGVSPQELKDVITELHKKSEISEIDQENLLKLIKN